jgi:transcriptional regulator with XRE-family HTH domain
MLGHMSQMQTTPTIPEWTMGDRLRKARQTMTDMTAREFAEHIGVSHGTITNAETDARQVRRIVINAYSLATGVPVEWLLTGQAAVDNGNGPDTDANGDTCWYMANVVQLAA